jgi:hypothetical protein
MPRISAVFVIAVLIQTHSSAQSRSPYAYARPLRGHPGIVISPYGTGRYVDVRGYKRGDKIRDPFTNKFFLVPETVPMPHSDPSRIRKDDR